MRILLIMTLFISSMVGANSPSDDNYCDSLLTQRIINKAGRAFKSVKAGKLFDLDEAKVWVTKHTAFNKEKILMENIQKGLIIVTVPFKGQKNHFLELTYQVNNNVGYENVLLLRSHKVLNSAGVKQTNDKISKELNSFFQRLTKYDHVPSQMEEVIIETTSKAKARFPIMLDISVYKFYQMLMKEYLIEPKYKVFHGLKSYTLLSFKKNLPEVMSRDITKDLIAINSKKELIKLMATLRGRNLLIQTNDAYLSLIRNVTIGAGIALVFNFFIERLNGHAPEVEVPNLSLSGVKDKIVKTFEKEFNTEAIGEIADSLNTNPKDVYENLNGLEFYLELSTGDSLNFIFKTDTSGRNQLKLIEVDSTSLTPKIIN